MPCSECGTSHVSGICKQCLILDEMEQAVEDGRFGADGGDD